MRYSQAYAKFGKYYSDRYSVEFPEIFSFCSFRDKSVLEIDGKKGYFARAVKKKTRKYKSTKFRAGKVTFADSSFDIVFSRWVVQGIDNPGQAIKEMCRVAKCCVIIVLPSEQGDQTKVMQVKYKNKYKYRKERIQKIKKIIRMCGFKVKTKKKLLRFVFPDIKMALSVLTAVDFENKLTKTQKQKVEKFLLRRNKKGKIIFTQGAAFICGCKC